MPLKSIVQIIRPYSNKNYLFGRSFSARRRPVSVVPARMDVRHDGNSEIIAKTGTY